MMRSVGHARAYALARDIAVIVDDDHARRHDVNFLQTATRFFRALGNASTRPVGHLLVKAGAKNDAVAGAAGDAKRLRSLGGNVDRHGTPADFELHVAAGALLALRNIDVAIEQEIADAAQTPFDLEESCFCLI